MKPSSPTSPASTLSSISPAGSAGPVGPAKTIALFVAVFLGLQLVFVGCNLAAGALPKQPIIEHWEASQDNPVVGRVFEYDHSLLGSSVAYDNNRFIGALAKENPYDGDLLKATTLASIEDTVPTGTMTFDYYRYWHGWSLLAFLCLTFGDINILIVAVAIITVLATALLVNQLRYYLGWIPAVLFCLVAFFATNIFGNFLGDILLGNAIFVLVLVNAAMLYGARRYPGHRKMIAALGSFIGGCVFNYLDFFTLPAFAIGLTVFCAMLASGMGQQSFKQGVLDFLKLSALFLLGFLATWLVKWAMAAAYLGVDFVASNVLGEMGLWSHKNDLMDYDSNLYRRSPRLYAVVASLMRVGYNLDTGAIYGAGLMALGLTAGAVVSTIFSAVKALRSSSQASVASGFWSLYLSAIFPPLFALITCHHTLYHLPVFTYKSWAFTLACLVALGLCYTFNHGKSQERSR